MFVKGDCSVAMKVSVEAEEELLVGLIDKIDRRDIATICTYSVLSIYSEIYLILQASPDHFFFTRN